MRLPLDDVAFPSSACVSYGIRRLLSVGLFRVQNSWVHLSNCRPDTWDGFLKAEEKMCYQSNLLS